MGIILRRFSKKILLTILVLCLCLNLMVINTKESTKNNVDNLLFGIEPSSSTTWLVMVYFDSDIDYEWGAMDSIQELEAGYVEDSNVEVVFIIDRVDGIDRSNGDWTGTRIYHLKHDTDPMSIGSELVDDLGEKNMGDGTTLTNFVLWAQTTYTADKTALILFNHGGALSGICYDWTSDDHLTLDEVQQAMDGLHVDLVLTEACGMGTLEVAYEWRTFADYFGGSELSVYLEAFDYQTSIEELCANPSLEPWEFGEIVAESFVETFDRVQTYSIINCSTLIELTSQLSTLGTQLLDLLPSNATKLSNLRCLMHSMHRNQLVDLRNMTLTLKEGYASNSEITTTLTAIESAIDEAILYNFVGPPFTTLDGLSIFFPQDNVTVYHWEEYINDSINGDLIDMDFITDTQWDEFMGEYIDLAPMVTNESEFYNVHEDYLELDTEYDLEVNNYCAEIYVMQIIHSGVYNFTIDITDGDMAFGVFPAATTNPVICRFPTSDRINPDEGTQEIISVYISTGTILIQIASYNYLSTGTLTVTQSNPKIITLNENITGSFPNVIGIQPPDAIYNYYSIDLPEGTFEIFIDVSYPVGLEVSIINDLNYHFIDYKYGIPGGDFSYLLNLTRDTTVRIYFGSYTGSGTFSLIVRTPTQEGSLHFIYLFSAIPVISIIILLKRKKKTT